ncbi:MAG: LysE family transporter [Bacteroidota bacterium]
MLHYLILGITFAFAAAVQPGPLQTYLISQSLSKGHRHTLPAAFSPLISDGPIIVLVLLVLSALPRLLVNVLQLAGGFFLLYLAISAWKTWRDYDAKKAVQVQSSQQTLLKAAMVNLLNPNPYLGWSLVMGPLLLKGWRETPVNGITLLVGFYATLVVCLVGTIMLFSTARNLGPRVSRVLIGISAIALACFGFYELWSGIAALGWL